MAGLYIHIPFCRKLCYYCDFHFSVSLKLKPRLLEALGRELHLRKNELNESQLDTVYLGGGTPSVLDFHELDRVFKWIFDNYKVSDKAEISFEANPDDLTEEYLQYLKNNTPVNRLSIGTQSFFDKHLRLMNRRHTGQEARASIELAKAQGFNNITLDLIYGVPGMSDGEWNRNLDALLSLNIPHFSAYHLSIEPKTVFAHFQKKGKLSPVDEDTSYRHFKTLVERSKQEGYEQYEISNFARNKQYSQHNLGYWTGNSYLGFGPSAHSFSGEKRRWNVANNTVYVQALEQGNNNYFETETIDTGTAFNEYLLTRLRTKWGIDKSYILKTFGSEKLNLLLQELKPFIADDSILESDHSLALSTAGILKADYIISTLMQV